MTILCAWEELGVGIWIGADSQTSYASGLMLTLANKWVTIPDEGLALGLSGSTRLRSLVTREPGKFITRDAWETADKLRNLVRDDEWKDRANDGDPASYSIELLHASVRDGIHRIDGDFAVQPIPSGILAAAGSGMDTALGAGHALAEVGIKDGSFLVGAAIRAAIAFDNHCGGEVKVNFLESK